MKKIYITILLLLIVFFYAAMNKWENTKPVKSADSSFTKPHDTDPDAIINKHPHSDYPEGVTFGSTDAPVVFTNVNISNNTAPQNEPSVKISRKNPNNVLAAWRDFRIGVTPAVRRVGYSFSNDGGTSWSTSQLLDSLLIPGHLRNSDPAITVDTAGWFYCAVISLTNSNGDGTLAVYRSTNGGQTFPVATVAASSTGMGFGEDKEYITCDYSPTSPFCNTVYITWTRFAAQQLILMTKSTDRGLTWSLPAQVSDQEGVQGSDPVVANNGELYVTWVGNLGIYFDKSTNGGGTFGTDVVVSAATNTDGFPSIAAAPQGHSRTAPLYIVWSDDRNSDFDVFLSASFDRGATWSSPRRVNDDMIGNGKIQYWPWIAVNDSGKIAIVYYDTRNTPNTSIIEAYLATSNDQGMTFTNQLLSTQQSPTNQPNGDVRFGDYIGIDFWKNRIVPVWTDERAGGFDMDIYTAVVDITVGTTPVSGIIPNAFSLNQNYPNPFNPSTTISFNVPKLTNLNIKLFNAEGKEITTLVSGEYKPGIYEVNWNASLEPSGVYFYKMTTNEFSETKKMVLVK